MYRCRSTVSIDDNLPVTVPFEFFLELSDNILFLLSDYSKIRYPKDN